jgi:hypothetical protein
MCTVCGNIEQKNDNIAEFGDVSNEFFYISENKEMFSDNRKRPLSFLFLSSTEKSFLYN